MHYQIKQKIYELRLTGKMKFLDGSNFQSYICNHSLIGTYSCQKSLSCNDSKFRISGLFNIWTSSSRCNESKTITILCDFAFRNYSTLNYNNVCGSLRSKYSRLEAFCVLCEHSDHFRYWFRCCLHCISTSIEKNI